MVCVCHLARRSFSTTCSKDFSIPLAKSERLTGRYAVFVSNTKTVDLWCSVQIYNNLYIGHQDPLVAFFPKIDKDERNDYERHELEMII